MLVEASVITQYFKDFVNMLCKRSNKTVQYVPRGEKESRRKMENDK